MGYTEKEIRDEAILALQRDVNSLYNLDRVKQTGATTDTHRPFTEIIAEVILENIDSLNRIKRIRREASYRTKGHGSHEDITSNHEEERLAIKLFQRATSFPGFGRILDYQVPLKNKLADKAGKIDLLSIQDNKVYILELKKEDSPESMLRCVLESYTYSKIVDDEKLKADFDIPETATVIPAPLVFEGGKQYNEYHDIDGEHPLLRELMHRLHIIPFFINPSYFK